MPRTKPRRRLQPEQRRQELLEAGERVVRRLGASTRVEDIVRVANASQGTFYVYFDTWEAFLLALRERVFQRLQMRFDDYQRGCTNWEELVGGLPALFIELTSSLEGLHRAVLHGPIAQVPVANPQLNVLSRLGRLIEQGVTEGAMQTGDVADTTRFVFALLHEAADLVESGQDAQRIADTLRSLLLNALQVRQVPIGRSPLD